MFHRDSELFCVSGQRATELRRLVVRYGSLLRGKKVVVLIGTNDVLRNTSFSCFQSVYASLVSLLEKNACEVHVCEILPIPRFTNTDQRFDSVKDYNECIRSFESAVVKVIHCHARFVQCNIINEGLYCKFIGKNGRTDLVHPNKCGLNVLFLTLEAL